MTKVFRAKDLKLSTTAARNRLLTAIPISDIGIRSNLTGHYRSDTMFDRRCRRNGIPMRESTSEISVGISPAVWETLGTIPASRRIPKIKSWNPGAQVRSYITKSWPASSRRRTLFPFCQFMGRGYNEYEGFAMHGDNIEGRVPTNRQTKKSNVERPGLQHLYLLRRENIAQRELYFGI